MRYLSVVRVLALHRKIIATSGGAVGVRDLGLLQSALAQPRLTFDGVELYPDLIEKAAALGFSIILNHPFIDGNKRVGHAVIEVFLMLNGYEIEAGVDEQERVILAIAAGEMKREEFTGWLWGCVRSRE
ncbi:MAG: type II toxin-antitoxin system death-on-curing family toxin [Oscillatoriales cyanobacterium]|nr:MAG: type II toxin-antitoxin system death-on-curing family toxin [Oscillatoriales cyanobacterium]